jgi:hypothetical protein
LREATREISTERELRNEINRKIEDRERSRYLLAENMGFEYESGSSFKGRLTLYAERDERLFVSVRMIGFEIVRAEITPDSLKYINRLQKEYYFGPMTSEILNISQYISFEEVQDLLFFGFLYLPEKAGRNYMRKFTIKDENIVFDEVLDEGRRIINSYSLRDVKLEKSLITDYNQEFFAEIDLERKSGELKEINAAYTMGRNIGNLRLQTGSIKNKEYTRTDFRIGRNYEEVSKIF